jgi:hypothetical protein
MLGGNLPRRRERDNLKLSSLRWYESFGYMPSFVVDGFTGVRFRGESLPHHNQRRDRSRHGELHFAQHWRSAVTERPVPHHSTQHARRTA